MNRGIRGIVLVGAIDANLSTVASFQLRGSRHIQRGRFPFHPQFTIFYTFHNFAPLRASALDAANLPLPRLNQSPLPRLRSAGIFPFALSTGFSHRRPPFVGNVVSVRPASKRKEIFFLPSKP